MLKNARFWGLLLWLFSLQVFMATSGGMLGENIWLDIATGVGMFTVAAFLLGYSLPEGSQLSFASVFLLIAAASAVITFRVHEVTPYRWYDLMTIVAAPQVFVMGIAGLLAVRRSVADNTRLTAEN